MTFYFFLIAGDNMVSKPPCKTQAGHGGVEKGRRVGKTPLSAQVISRKRS